VDLGIKTLATVSDGQTFDAPKPLRSKLRKLQRLGRDVSRKVKGSSNRRKAVRRLAKFYHKISNIRKDVLHKITTVLAKTKRIIGIEDLNVSGMMKNRCLSRAIADLGLFEWRRQLEYKGKWYNCLIKVIDRWFPSSKTCSVCGEINDNLTLADREWTCEGCHTKHDRDHNASKNIEYVAASLSVT
jgi:putative transposase